MADEEEDFQITINRDYAKRFEKNKQRAELDRLKAKYGDSGVDPREDSSSSEEEDEDAEGVTSQKEKDFLTMLSMLKKKDPKIYDKEATFYHSDDSSGDSSQDENEKHEKKPKKPMYLKDYERERLLKKGSKAFVSDDESSEEEDATKQSDILTYDEEQRALKESFKVAAEETEDNDEGFLSVRQKTKQEKEKEELEYKEWLKGEKRRIDEQEAKQMDTLQRYWTDPNLDQDEVFLRDYILDRKYIDKDDERIPTYNEIVDEEEEDEEEVEKQEEFERKFNFRYEEPDASFVKTYPRTISASVRQKDERRKEARKQREERKKKEKEQKHEEIKRLKNLKRKEIQEKLEKLKEITGNPNVGFTDDDVEGNFDPAKYDEAMKKVFSDDYYEDADDEKPEFDDDELGDDYEENWDEWEGPSYHGNNEDEYAAQDVYHERHIDDPGFNMDADYDPSAPVESSRKSKKKTKFARALETKKPLYDPNEKTFEEYFDEYYKLDYEDIIGDLPVRFKYRQVVPNDFGLSTEEMLENPERELNQWVSVKKMSQYRTEDEERQDLKKYRKLSRDEKRKRRVFTSKGASTETNEISTESRTQASLADDSSQAPAAKVPKTTADSKSSTINLSVTEENNHQEIQKRTGNTKKRTALLLKQGWRRRLTAKEQFEMAKKKKLSRQFKGARQDKLAKLSADRLAAYGLKKKR